jgi:prepilin-type N-terminal cleavage/methylation domain-containing protein
MDPRSRAETGRRESGFTLVEVILALSIFTVFALAASITLLRGIEHRRTTFNEYRARSAVRSLIAQIQDTANRDHDSAAQEGIAFVYERYHGQTTTVPDLKSGTITVTCYADEATVPADLGGPQDLNFDGDAEDDLSGAPDDLRMVPITLAMTYVEKDGSRSFTTHRLITKTTD